MTSEPARAWFVDVDPGRALAIAVDGSDDVIAAGRLDATTQDALVVKLAGADGSELWRRGVEGAGGGDDIARTVVVASNDDVVAAGVSVGNATAEDALVCRLAAADGTEVWRVDRDGGVGGLDTANEIALDGSGDVVVAGRISLGAAEPQFSVLKLAGATGADVWQTALMGDGTATSIAVDATDGIVAAGSVGPFMTVAKLTSGGGVTWQTNVAGDPSADDLARAIALDGTAAVVVAGEMTTDAGARDFAVVSLDATDGMENWRHVIDGAATGADDVDTALDVAVDAAGDVFAVGQLSGTGGNDLIAVKLDGATGAEVWRVIIDGPGGGADEAQAVALIGGDVVVVGRTDQGANGRDAVVLRLAGATGHEIWRHELDGGTQDNDLASSVAIDGQGDVVAGLRTRMGSIRRFGVLKVAGRGGGDFPCGNAMVDPGEDCDDGNQVVGDGCRANCTAERCGDGIIDPGEDCDPGGSTDPCCSGTCTVLPDQTACDDGDACTINEVCTAGACGDGAPVVCGACETCESATGCEARMLSGCRISTKPKTSLLLKDKDRDKKDVIKWVWKKGGAISVRNFGDPTSTDAMSFCLFDQSSARPALLAGMTVPAGSSWKLKKTTMRFKDKTGTPDGIRAAKLKAAVAGKSTVSVSGKGENLPMPALPLALPVTVQLQSATGACWEATYGEGDARKNTPALFKGKGGSAANP